jgi:hypothetical protein
MVVASNCNEPTGRLIHAGDENGEADAAGGRDYAEMGKTDVPNSSVGSSSATAAARPARRVRLREASLLPGIEDVEQAVTTSADARPMIEQRRDRDGLRPARRDTYPRRDAAGSIHIVAGGK